MKLIRIYSRIFPPKGYTAITLLCFMVIRRERKDTFPWWAQNHEEIHFRQELELLFIGFYVLYLLEFLVKLCVTRSWSRAYRSVSLEQEAYYGQMDHIYLRYRRHYRWKKYIFKLNPRI